MSDNSDQTEPDIRDEEEVEALENAGGEVVGPDEAEGRNSA